LQCIDCHVIYIYKVRGTHPTFSTQPLPVYPLKRPWTVSGNLNVVSDIPRSHALRGNACLHRSAVRFAEQTWMHSFAVGTIKVVPLCRTRSVQSGIPLRSNGTRKNHSSDTVKPCISH